MVVSTISIPKSAAEIGKRVVALLWHPLGVTRESARACFIDPMLLLPTDKLPEGEGWLYEVKFDGYRALAIKSGGQVRLRSRNDKDFTKRYPGVVAALHAAG